MVTIPADISGLFLAGDEIQYSCQGNLLPDEPDISTCTDLGFPLASWSIIDLSQLSVCSKCFKTTMRP